MTHTQTNPAPFAPACLAPAVAAIPSVEIWPPVNGEVESKERKFASRSRMKLYSQCDRTCFVCAGFCWGQWTSFCVDDTSEDDMGVMRFVLPAWSMLLMWVECESSWACWLHVAWIPRLSDHDVYAKLPCGWCVICEYVIFSFIPLTTS